MRVSFFAVWAAPPPSPPQTANKNMPPPKQQKHTHTHTKKNKIKRNRLFRAFVLFCCLGRWACLLFCCLGGGRVVFCFSCLCGGRVLFLLFGRGGVFFCCLGGGLVYLFAVWAGRVLFFAVWAWGGSSLTYRFAWLVFKRPNNKKDQTAKQQHGFRRARNSRFAVCTPSRCFRLDQDPHGMLVCL